MIIRQNLMSRFRIWGIISADASGTFETCGRALRMSADRGGPEVAGHRQNDAGPISDVGIAGHRPTILLYDHSISPSPGGAS